MNWKHGGESQVGIVKYSIVPQTDRYLAGLCGIHINEEYSWSGRDGPGTSRKHKFQILVDAKDTAGKIIGGTNGNQVWAGDGSPYRLENLYYGTLEFTPEAREGNYIQFTLGDQSWRTNAPGPVAHCSVGDWDGDYSPKVRGTHPNKFRRHLSLPYTTETRYGL